MPIQLPVHPLLELRAFIAAFPRPLGETEDEVRKPLPRPGPDGDFAADFLASFGTPPMPTAIGPTGDPLRLAVRDLLRRGGFKPTGRSKPASEYLIKAAAEGALARINPAVDACNAVSLHSGFPISVVDVDRLQADGALRVAIAPDPPGSAPDYVFNASGQTIDIEGLLCLFDDIGPCANAVKDAQRTKTHARTTRTLSILWGVAGHEARLAHATRWYREILTRQGAIVGDVVLLPAR